MEKFIILFNIYFDHLNKTNNTFIFLERKIIYSNFFKKKNYNNKLFHFSLEKNFKRKFQQF